MTPAIADDPTPDLPAPDLPMLSGSRHHAGAGATTLLYWWVTPTGRAASSFLRIIVATYLLTLSTRSRCASCAAQRLAHTQLAVDLVIASLWCT